VPAERAEWARTYRDLIAGEILATSFEFGEPADAAEIGDGVRVAITRESATGNAFPERDRP
jgi:isoleucyl-tRNA synthetase